MAVPSNARSLRGAPLKSGIVLGVSPSSDPTFDVEIARATSSGVYATIARLTPQGAGMPVTYPDILPMSTYTYSYKARAAKEGWLAGDYTAVVSARPLPMPEILPNITPLTGKGIGAPLFVSTAAPMTVGQKVAAANVRKYLTFPFTSLFSESPGVLTQMNPPLAYPANGVAGSASFSAPLPPGVTIREATLFAHIGSSTGGASTGDRILCYVAVGETDHGSLSTVANLSVTSTYGAGTWSNTATGISTLTSTDNMVFGRALIFNVSSASTNKAGFVAIRIGYDMPSYDKAV